MIYLAISGFLFLAIFFVIIAIELAAARRSKEQRRIEKVISSASGNISKEEILASFQKKETKKVKYTEKNDDIIYIFSAPLAFAAYLGMKSIEHTLTEQTAKLIYLIPVSIFILIPFFYKKAKREARNMEILTLLPTFIDLLTICIKAGLSFSIGIEKIIKEVNLKSKFFFKNLQLAALEMNAGVDKETALKTLVKRCYNHPDLKSFVSAILQAETFGFSISKTLQTQAEEIRNKRRQVIRARIARMPIALLFPLVFCIAPITCILLAGPGLIDILTNL